jgi:cysteine synthase B
MARDAQPGGVSTVVDLIGNTPLLRLRYFERLCPGVELYAKAEWHNPGGSVKDRPAARMIADGVAKGALTKAKILLDATSGNTGIAYAMIGAAEGHRVKLCMPTNVTPERKKILRAYGAELVYTDPMDGSDGAIREARRLYAHYEGTGPEILEQTGGRVTHFVAGLGTSGTFMGVGRRLREYSAEHNRGITLVSIQPDSPLHGLEGLKHMETAIVPGIYDETLADQDVRVGTEASYRAVRQLAAEEGLLVGPSSGAALTAGLNVARELREGVVVMIFCDGGEKYLTQRFWDDQ